MSLIKKVSKWLMESPETPTITDNIKSYLDAHQSEHDVVHEKCKKEKDIAHVNCWRWDKVSLALGFGILIGVIFGAVILIKFDMEMKNHDWKVMRGEMNYRLKDLEKWQNKLNRLDNLFYSHEQHPYWDGHGKMEEY